jgi:hypothetical protein
MNYEAFKRRSGITLTEILIGIMILGIGMISLATLFPIGLLRMRRSVHDVRSTVAAQNAVSEVAFRNIVSPPLGPWFIDNGNGGLSVAGVYSPLSADPDGLAMLGTASYTGGAPPFRPTTGIGIPVVIDPLWTLQNLAVVSPLLSRVGAVDANANGTVDFLGAQGLVRVGGGIASLNMAYEIFASDDDITFGEVDQAERQRIIPLQALLPAGPITPPPPPYLTPTNGVPFYPNTLFRDRRYTWMAIVRKVAAGQVYGRGPNSALGFPVADADDLLDNVGPDGIANDPSGTLPPPPPPRPPYSSIDDPASDMATSAPVLAPVGPFQITVVAFYNRDFVVPDLRYANDVFPVAATPEPSITRPVPIFCPVPRVINIGATTYGPFAPNEATLMRRNDGIPFPEIPVGSYILDSTFDGSVLNIAGQTVLGPRGGHVYRVTAKNLNPTGNILVLTLDQPARPNGPIPLPAATEPPYLLPLNKPDAAGHIWDPGGYVLTLLRGAIGVFEQQIP